MSRRVQGKNAQILLLAVVAIGMFMDSLDGSIVNIALPSMTKSFGIDTGAASWIVTIYFLVVAGLILIFGKLAENGALKKIFIGGFAFFTVGSAMCALSPTIEILLISRAVQGIGAAMIASSAMMICVKYLPASKLGFGLSITVLGASVGVAAGPVIGGMLTHFLSWHWVFLINIPIGLVVILLALKAIPDDVKTEKKGLDTVGAALLFVSLVSGLYVLESGPSIGLNLTMILLLAVFAVTMTAFVLRCRKVDNPVLDLGLFKNMNFNAVLIAFMLLNTCYVGAQYLLPFYMDKALGFDALISGLYLVIPAAVTLLISSKAGRLSDRTERRAFMIGANLALLIAMVILALIDPGMGPVPLVVSLALMGLVFGLGGGPGGSRIVENTPEDKRSAGSTIMSFIIYFGSALGTTVFSATFRIGSGSGEGFALMSASQFMGGFHFAMIVGTVLALIALVLSASSERRKEAGGASMSDRELMETMGRYHYALTLTDLSVMASGRDGRGLTYNDILYLNLIDYIPDCTASKIADVLHVAKSSVTIKVNDLCDKGYVERIPSETDGRVRYLVLSKETGALYREEDSRISAAISDVRSRYSESEMRSFCEIMDALSESIIESGEIPNGKGGN